MKIFNTIAVVVLLIAVGFLFYEVYDKEPAKVRPATDEDLSESLEGQDFKGVRIAYINTDSLVEKYDYHRELRSKLEKRAKQLEQDLEKKSRTFQENVQLLQQQADQMSEAELQAAQMDLQQIQQQLMDYRDEKSGELAEEEQELNLLIMDDMESILENIKEEFNLDYILSYDPSSILLAANEDYNITDIVVERLNKKHKDKVSEE